MHEALPVTIEQLEQADAGARQNGSNLRKKEVSIITKAHLSQVQLQFANSDFCLQRCCKFNIFNLAVVETLLS